MFSVVCAQEATKPFLFNRIDRQTDRQEDALSKCNTAPQPCGLAPVTEEKSWLTTVHLVPICNGKLIHQLPNYILECLPLDNYLM